MIPPTTDNNSDMTGSSGVPGGGGTCNRSGRPPLESPKATRLLDSADKFRNTSLTKLIKLPQVIVVGDQSSGKSSVLERICGVPFPSHEGICTRFATEVVMRKREDFHIRITIKPDDTSSKQDKKKFQTFDGNAANLEELPTYFTEATKLMGFNDADDGESDLSASGLKTFSKHVLSIEISDPDQDRLTIVDLPGIIQSQRGNSTKQDVEFPKELLHSYAKNEHTVILAVVAANLDIEQQSVLAEVAKADPNRERTMGIITKMDKVRDEPLKESQYLQLAENKDPANRFGLGWQFVRNRSSPEMGTSFEESNAVEEMFFSQGVFQNVPARKKGIFSLVERITDVCYKLHQHVLPRCLTKISAMLDEETAARNCLGEKKINATEQRDLLMLISQHYQSAVENAVLGHYSHGLAPSATRGPNDNVEQAPIFLRAEARGLNEYFLDQMRSYGHQHAILQKGSTSQDIFLYGRPLLPIPDGEELASDRDTLTHEGAVWWVQDLVVKLRGNELSGNYNPELIPELFKEQSRPWAELSRGHIDKIDDLVVEFIKRTVLAVATPRAGAEVAQNLHSWIEKVLDQRYERAMAEARRILADMREPIMS